MGGVTHLTNSAEKPHDSLVSTAPADEAGAPVRVEITAEMIKAVSEIIRLFDKETDDQKEVSKDVIAEILALMGPCSRPEA